MKILLSKIKIVVAIAVMATTFFVATPKASAALYFGTATSTSAATSTINFMTPGTGTTTLTFDAFAGYGVNTQYSPAYAVALIDFTGSSTSSILGIAAEYSQNGTDWYRNTLIEPSQIGTTTQAINLNTTNTYNLKYAVESLGGNAATTTYDARIISLPIFTRYLRLVNTITGANGSLYETFVPTKLTP